MSAQTSAHTSAHTSLGVQTSANTSAHASAHMSLGELASTHRSSRAHTSARMCVFFLLALMLRNLLSLGWNVETVVGRAPAASPQDAPALPG